MWRLGYKDKDTCVQIVETYYLKIAIFRYAVDEETGRQIERP